MQRALSEERLSVNEALFKLTEIQAELIAGVGDARARKQLRDSVAVELRRMTIAAREDRIEAGTPDFETVSHVDEVEDVTG